MMATDIAGYCKTA